MVELRVGRPARLLRLAISGAVALACASPALAADAPPLAYVTNQQGDVSVLDLSTLEITGSVSAYGKEPRGIGITTDGKLLVVANREGGRIAVIDRASGNLVRYVAIGANPEFVRVRGHQAFVTYEPGSSGGPPVAPGEAASAASAPAKDEDSDDPAHVAIVDLDKGVVLRSIRGGKETEGVEFSADGKRLIVANEADNTLTVHDIASGRLLKTVDTKAYGNRPRGIKLMPDRKHYAASLEFSDAVIILDANFRIVQSLKTAGAPYGIGFDRRGERMFVAAAKSKVLQVFDAKTLAHIADVPTGGRCWHFTFTPDDKDILVACGRSGEVVVIDASTLAVTKRVADAKMPWGIVTWPIAPGSIDALR